MLMPTIESNSLIRRGWDLRFETIRGFDRFLEDEISKCGQWRLAVVSVSENGGRLRICELLGLNDGGESVNRLTPLDDLVAVVMENRLSKNRGVIQREGDGLAICLGGSSRMIGIRVVMLPLPPLLHVANGSSDWRRFNQRQSLHLIAPVERRVLVCWHSVGWVGLDVSDIQRSYYYFLDVHMVMLMLF